MPRILSRRQAVADLEDIWSHIAQDNPDAADHFIDLIEAGCRILAENPLMGRLRPELTPSLRSFPVGNYILFYMPLANGIEIVRVISGFRDIDVLF